MKKSLFVLLIILLVKSNLSAQHISLEEDFEQFLYVSDEEIIFTIEVSTATISGEIQSAVCTTITPSSTNVIIIKDPEGANRLGGGSKGTVIRPKPGIGIGPKTINPKPKIDILLNQSNNDIQITSNEGLITGFTLYDLSGKLISTEKTTPTNNYNISTNQLKNAIYILKIDLENQPSKTIKIIKK
jgi:hypothetical protein